MTSTRVQPLFRADVTSCSMIEQPTLVRRAASALPAVRSVSVSRCGGQLVDHTDEGTRANRGTDREDSQADDPALRLGDDDRRGRDKEQAAQPIGVVAPLLVIDRRILQQDADCGSTSVRRALRT